MSKVLQFRCALVTGGGGGIGKAMAQYFISQGKKVLLAGRTKANLEASAQEIGAAGCYVLDVGDSAAIRTFAQQITHEHPDLDCVVNNAGVQRPLTVLGDTDDFLGKADEEININVRGPLHLTMHLLPHLQQQQHPVVVNVSSILGFVPFAVGNPVYNGTKAWLHFWSMNLRTQLRQGGSRVRVVEIAPPTVGTDLHRDRADPDDNKKEKNDKALTVDEFVADVARKLESGEEMISAGMGVGMVEDWYATFGKRYRDAEAAN
ncbi:short-chain dehydrogenases/reductase, putative [Cordyceps militaris CM01]|uniref:Short-chain dehydrogenases/reductase, putative n=1 Tax=Cordyceps militaris (strain CM01) TaxID=983644 RepID=G3JMU6_CORMM|nr:short-chain dehydrogenases/reductase, putative [Cordyceps militaris CM01]EGX90128.1 short-chain dehydrogenases/reductase, putative [Cordyceps militaris CM01]